MRRSLCLLLILAQPLQAAGPAAAALDALRDAAQLNQVEAYDTRYLWHPEAPRIERTGLYALQVNLLSRQDELIAPRRVQADLYAIKLSDYGIDAKTWEKLADNEPYLHEQRIIKANDVYSFYWVGGQGFKPGWYRNQKARVDLKLPASGRWMPKEHDALIETCNTVIPLVRADWFFAQTSVSVSKVGYYDFLGLKNRADAEKLAGLDRKIAATRKKVMRATLIESGVAINNRQIEWQAAYDGDWWATLDSFQSTGKNNAPRLLNDADHDAEEIYYSLPNGLPGMLAGDAKGVLQKTVPDTIAHNKAARNDKRIHVPLGCMECHAEVVRPFTCDSRLLYRGRIRLESPDPVKFLQLRQLFLRDIYAVRDKSAANYAAAIKQISGLEPARVAALYGEEYDRYYRSLNRAQIAMELGVTEERLGAVIDAKIKAGLADPVLIGPGQNPEVKVRREHLEEAIGLLWGWLLGD
jgi:hypothetical protein